MTVRISDSDFTPAPAGGRSMLMDLLKVGASQLIVLHHLSVYDPLAATMARSLPGLIGVLHHQGRWAVQVFLVIGGYLAAAHLMPAGRGFAGDPVSLVFRRYVRLIAPLSVALVLAMVCAAIARQWMPGGNAPAAPTWQQCWAHLFLMQDVLGYDALSAGVWYVAIDFQLYVVLVVLLACGSAAGRMHGRFAMLPWLLVGGLAAASMLDFNRHPGLDKWAVYFFGSYGLGALVYRLRQAGNPVFWCLAIGTMVSAALVMDFRERLVVASCTALLLAASPCREKRFGHPAGHILTSLSQCSYLLFLVHYPVCLLANAAFTRWNFQGTTAASLWMAVAWSASMLAAGCFNQWLQRPGLRLTAWKRAEA